MKNTLSARWLLLVLGITCSRLAPGQTYFSTASGSWNSAIWEDELGNPVSDPDGFGISVVINPGHAVTLPGSGTREINDLTVSAGASLNLGGSANFFLEVFGNTVEINGTIGSPSLSATSDVGLEIMGAACSISGTGSVFLSRLRKADDAENNDSRDTDLSIQMDVALKWNGTALYNTKGGTFNVTVSSGATVRIPNGDLSMDGLSGNGVASSGGRLTVNGDLLMPNGDLYLRTNNSSAPVEYVLGPAGRIRVGGVIRGNDPAGPAVARLDIQSGGRLELTGTTAWQDISSTSRNDIVLQPGSIVEYRSASTQTIESALAYSNLIAAGGGSKTLNGSCTVNGNLNLDGSRIRLNGHELTVNGSAGGSPNAFVLTDGGGQLVQSVGSAQVLFPVGNSFYNPIILSQLSPAASVGVRVADVVLENGTSGAAVTDGVVNACWYFTGGSGLTLTATVGWDDLQEQPSFLDSDCFISYYDGGWQQGSPSDGTSNNLTRSGIPLPAPLAVGSGVALPVELSHFSAVPQTGSVLLKWQTETERNNDYFAVERAGDDLEFVEIGRVSGHGTTFNPRHYTFRDKQPLAGISYYRLRQVDRDGTYTYSPVRSVPGSPATPSARVFPNPTAGTVSLLLGRAAPGSHAVIVYDAAGRAVRSQRLKAGRQQLDLDLSDLPDGRYVLRWTGETHVIHKQ